jgi:hypothetical protein
MMDVEMPHENGDDVGKTARVKVLEIHIRSSWEALTRVHDYLHTHCAPAELGMVLSPHRYWASVVLVKALEIRNRSAQEEQATVFDNCIHCE